MVYHGSKNTYVIEFKHNKSTTNALTQIELLNYAKQFNISSQKPVVLVAINFNTKLKSLKVDNDVRKVVEVLVTYKETLYKDFEARE